jgi:hypothetical protein
MTNKGWDYEFAPKTRSSVETLETKQTKDGPAELVLIYYMDGSRSFGVSEPGGITLFGNDRGRAEQVWAKY